MSARCTQTKQSRFDLLRCCRDHGHAGPCNFCVVGVLPAPGVPGAHRKQSDVNYERRKARHARTKGAT